MSTWITDRRKTKSISNKSQITLARRQIAAFEIAVELFEVQLINVNSEIKKFDLFF